MFDFSYLITAVLAKVFNNPKEINTDTWRLIIAGIIGAVLYVISAIIVIVWIYGQFQS
jgi:hypothetical protein